MAKYLFEVERTYTWNVEVDAESEELAKEKILKQTFCEVDAQQGYLEIVDVKEEED